MKTGLVCIALLALAHTAVANSFDQEVQVLYQPADAKAVKILTFLPPRKHGGGSHAAGDRGRGRCPEKILIGSVEGKKNRIFRFDPTVVINAPIYVRCG